jgi:hypothetical protein
MCARACAEYYAYAIGADGNADVLTSYMSLLAFISSSTNVLSGAFAYLRL